MNIIDQNDMEYITLYKKENYHNNNEININNINDINISNRSRSINLPKINKIELNEINIANTEEETINLSVNEFTDKQENEGIAIINIKLDKNVI